MNDIVLTGLIMAGAYGAMRLWKNIQAARRTRIEQQMAEAAAPSEPRDLGTLKRTADGSFAPEQR
jgi:hypothetical protein